MGGEIRTENLASCQTVFDLLLAYSSKSVSCVIAFWFVYFFFFIFFFKFACVFYHYEALHNSDKNKCDCSSKQDV